MEIRHMPATRFQIEINPRIPRRLARLQDLADNLWYGWHRPTRSLFARLDARLWHASGNSPKEFLRRVDERILVDAAEDPVFLASFNQVLSAYDSYHGEPMRREGSSEWLRQSDLIAYFCAEFGLHESFPIYSGGLGILAGDHCKAASDLRLPFVAVGLLYRQGYFQQQIDAEGNQLAIYTDSDFDHLPIEEVRSDDGGEMVIGIEFPGRTVWAKAWSARIGHVTLYLLDTDIDRNGADDRDITHQLYGGDRTMRVRQEFVLGMGGVRLLSALGLRPTAWHINEGHAAFQVLARALELVRHGCDFEGALEAVAANTVFTTHTPVPAGHDHFPFDLLSPYLQRISEELGVGVDRLYSLGLASGNPEFNMTALAIRGSRFQNGVSRIHGGVSANICADLWPQIEPAENPISYVTNGVHVPTFLAFEWVDVFDRYLGHEWRHKLCDVDFWERVSTIPDHIFWTVRQALKTQAMHSIVDRVREQNHRNHSSEAHLDRILKLADPSHGGVLTIGFARRFATYKRASLLFENVEWLKRIVSDPSRPVIFVFAGKAHPADKPGQDLIRSVAAMSRMPEFTGKILMLEGYDLGLARRLVSGVDVWLNNPLYPLEASGTSGMKAGINGTINLSVLDGWWGEGYDGSNGWAIKPASASIEEYRRNREDSQSLYEILEDQVLPLYYARGNLGFSESWIRMAKRSIATLMPRFNATRMVGEYLSRFYLPATRQWRRFNEPGFQNARRLAAWKDRVRAAWGGVRLRRVDVPPKRMEFGGPFVIEAAVGLNGLAPADVVVELLFDGTGQIGVSQRPSRFGLRGTVNEAGEHLFALEITPESCGRFGYYIRVYPYHELLTHPLEMGLMAWV
jgi:glycogen phosphorylase